MSYKVNNVYVSNRKNQHHVPSHINTNEICSCSSYLSTPTLTLQLLIPNKDDELLKQFQTKTSKNEDNSISSLDYSSSSTTSHKATHDRHQLLPTSKDQLNEGNTSNQSLGTFNPSHTRLDYRTSSQ